MSLERPAAVVVLAAGEGKRMKSSTPKVLHEIAGRSMLGHALAAAQALQPEQLIVVIGHGRDQVAPYLEKAEQPTRAVVQEQQNGTGHAVRLALADAGDLSGTLVVTMGDTPLLRGETLQALVRDHQSSQSAATVLTAVLADPAGYGRVMRDEQGAVVGIVEDKDASETQRAVREINSGMYAFDAQLLRVALAAVSTDNAQGEEYLTDVVAILRGQGHRVGAMPAPDADEILGVNDRAQLAEAGRLLRDRIVTHWMREGVTVVDPATTWIGNDVVLEPDAVVRPHTTLEGRTTISRGADVGPGCRLLDTVVGEGARVAETTADRAEIGASADVGPYTHLRPGTRLGPRTKAGSFVEMKEAVLGEGSKAPHLAYVGDADIGTGSNIGCASVFVNYDGITKHRTTVGDHVRIASDTMLVAPVTIGDGAYTAAGSVITEDVPPGALAVARGRQRNVEGWVERRRPGSAAARAAARARDNGGTTAPTVPEEGSS